MLCFEPVYSVGNVDSVMNRSIRDKQVRWWCKSTQWFSTRGVGRLVALLVLESRGDTRCHLGECHGQHPATTMPLKIYLQEAFPVQTKNDTKEGNILPAQFDQKTEISFGSNLP